jgi:hypothetical protein
MDKDQQIQVLQLTYAHVLADATLQLGLEGVLERVTERKRREQLATGSAKAKHFGITSPEQVFTALSACFGCASWRATAKEGGLVAETSGCVLFGLARMIDAPSPCRLYCLDPMEGMVKGLEPEADFMVQETLWDGEMCRVEVSGCDR